MDNLKDKNSPLSNISKENPFRVPNHYFDDFSARLQTKIEAEENIVPDRQPNRFIKILKPVLGLAASFALIFLLVYWPVKKFTPNQSAENQAEESILTYKDYVNLLFEEGDELLYAIMDDQSNLTIISDEDFADIVPVRKSEFELYAETYFNE